MIVTCILPSLSLQTIMRMLDNCSIETDDVKTIQDDLNYYVESNQEPDFAENELIYEDLHLDETAGGGKPVHMYIYIYMYMYMTCSSFHCLCEL